MADLLGDGYIRVSWVPSVGNIHAPTTTELNAGTALESYITPTGLKITPSTASVDTSSLASTFTTAGVGRRSYAISLECKRQTPADTAWNLLPYRTSGFLVVRRTLLVATAYTTGQQLEVYPTTTGEPANQNSAANEVQKFTVDFMLSTDADPRAVVA